MKQFEITSCLPKIRGEPRNPVQGLLRVQPFTPKLVNGKTYWITKAEVSVRTALGSSTRAMGIIFDKIKGREYALLVADFNRFMETGDLSLLPKGSSSSSKLKKPRLIELSLMQPEEGSWFSSYRFLTSRVKSDIKRQRRNTGASKFEVAKRKSIHCSGFQNDDRPADRHAPRKIIGTIEFYQGKPEIEVTATDQRSRFPSRAAIDLRWKNEQRRDTEFAWWITTVDKPEDFNAMVKNPEAKAHMKPIRGTTETDFHLYEVAHSFWTFTNE
jgi:hypothetical protein